MDILALDDQKMRDVINTFTEYEGNVRRLTGELSSQMQILRGGEFISDGATQFYNYMDQTLMPGMERLRAAFETAAETCEQITVVFNNAEQEAAACLPASGT